MKKSEVNLSLDRRQALRYTLGLMAAAASDPSVLDAWTPQDHPEHEQTTTDKHRPLVEGSPAFFNAAEFQALTRMVDLIIPKTDTPGAADAGVPLYIDLVVNSDHAIGDRIRNGLHLLDELSRKANKKIFVGSPEAIQIKVLQSLVPKKAKGNDFFETVKSMTIVGYYSSEIGLFDELRFKGNEALSTFPGCPHSGHPVEVSRKKTALNVIPDEPVRRWPFPNSDNITAEDL
jgi:gluconate 2-dehydrogenase gamma chain